MAVLDLSNKKKNNWWRIKVHEDCYILNSQHDVRFQMKIKFKKC